MNIRELKRRLLPFQGFLNDADDDGTDLGGEEITLTDPDGAPGPDEDRGDNFTPPGTAAPAPAPARAAAPAEPEGDDADDASGAPAGGGMIPKGRFNEVIAARNAEKERADALERELQALRQAAAARPAAPAPAPAAAPAAPEFNEAEQEEAYANALMDGDTKKAAQIRADINRHLREQAARDAIEQQRAADAASKLQQVAAQAVQDFPYLDTPEGAEVLALIKASRDMHVANGMPVDKALKKAVDTIAPKFAPQTETPSRELQTPAAPKDTRSADAIKRGASASIAQPPAVQAGIGNRATAAMVDVQNMSEDQFAQLSEAEKAKLRGDMV